MKQIKLVETYKNRSRELFFCSPSTTLVSFNLVWPVNAKCRACNLEATYLHFLYACLLFGLLSFHFWAVQAFLLYNTCSSRGKGEKIAPSQYNLLLLASLFGGLLLRLWLSTFYTRKKKHWCSFLVSVIQVGLHLWWIDCQLHIII